MGHSCDGCAPGSRRTFRWIPWKSTTGLTAEQSERFTQRCSVWWRALRCSPSRRAGRSCVLPRTRKVFRITSVTSIGTTARGIRERARARRASAGRAIGSDSRACVACRGALWRAVRGRPRARARGYWAWGVGRGARPPCARRAAAPAWLTRAVMSFALCGAVARGSGLCGVQGASRTQ